MAQNKSIDPMNYVTTNRFYVEIGGSLAASFSECSGLDVKVKHEPKFEGGVNHQQRIFLGRTEFSDITLKRGITDDITFWEWMQVTIDPSEKPKKRRNIAILVFNHAGETMQSWTLAGAVPVGWKTPSLQADSSSVAIEELVIAYEGLTVEKKKSGSALTNVTRDRTGFFGTGR